MDPITIIVSKAVAYLTKSFSESNSFKNFTEEFSDATINWIKPIFLKEDTSAKEVLEDLQNEPSEKLNIQAAENAIAKAIKKNPELEMKLRKLVEQIERVGGVEKTNSQSIIGNDNIGIQDVSKSKIIINKK